MMDRVESVNGNGAVAGLRRKTSRRHVMVPPDRTDDLRDSFSMKFSDGAKFANLFRLREFGFQPRIQTQKNILSTSNSSRRISETNYYPQRSNRTWHRLGH